MASLVLGAAGAAVGSFIGGPLGANIGWAIGSALGSALDPQKIEGPRITDLKLQNSQYGQMIPIVYASSRIAGQVIWQTDLHEHEQESGGKGGPVTTEYTYTASFGILLSEGPIAAVSRIWADGRLVHDSSSYENEATLRFKLYYGTEDQLPDPTMEAELGAGNVPAYRGFAYMVFDEIDLGEYGNRLPSFTFEVFTAVDSTVGLHEVNRVSNTSFEWGNDGTGDGAPWITSWPGTSAQIVVKDMTGGGGTLGHDYNNPELTYSGTTNDPGSNEHNIEIWGVGGITPLATYMSIGYANIQGHRNPLFVHPAFTVNLAGFDPPIGAGTVSSYDGVSITATVEVAANAGIDDWLFIGGTAVAPNGQNALLFTAATYGGDITEWNLMTDGEVTRSGPVTPPLPFGSLGWAAWDAGGLGIINSMENRGDYLWVLDANEDDLLSVYHIDPETSIFALDEVAGTLDLDDGQSGTRASMRTIKDGFVGIVMSDIVTVASRMPISLGEGVTLASVVGDLCDRVGLSAAERDLDQLEDDFIHGFVIATQGAARPIIGQLQSAFFFDAVESERIVKFVKRTNPSILTIPDDDLAAVEVGATRPALLTYTRAQEDELPRSVTVNYINSDEDYQQGSVPARRDTTISEIETTMALALTMTPTTARQVADRTLWMSWIERDRFVINLPRKYAHIEPTDVIGVQAWTMRLTRQRQIPNGVIQFDGVATGAQVYIPAGVGIRGLGYTAKVPPIKQHTDLMLLDTPLADEGDFSVGVYAAMAGKLASQWSGATIFQSKDDGVTYSQIGTVQTPAIMGTATSVLGDFPVTNLWDEANSVTVVLTPGVAGVLESLSEALVLGGANLACVGVEYIQFKNAVLTAPKTYVLSGLLRGRKGTEWAQSSHLDGERFVLMSTTTDLQLNAADVGMSYFYKAVTAGQAIEGATAIPLNFHAIRLQPLSPALIGGGVDAAGNVTINWIRRTRLGGAWVNHADVPLGEAVEKYVVQVWEYGYADCARVVSEVLSPTWVYTTAMQIVDFGAIQRLVYVTVAQVGTYWLGTQLRGTIQGLAAGALNSAALAPVDPYPVTFDPPQQQTGTADERHMENLADFMAGDLDSRRMGYHYANDGHTRNFLRREQFAIQDRFFRGDQWAMARWIQDSTYNKPFLTQPEAELIWDLADEAEGA